MLDSYCALVPRQTATGVSHVGHRDRAVQATSKGIQLSAVVLSSIFSCILAPVCASQQQFGMVKVFAAAALGQDALIAAVS